MKKKNYDVYQGCGTASTPPGPYHSDEYAGIELPFLKQQEEMVSVITMYRNVVETKIIIACLIFKPNDVFEVLFLMFIKKKDELQIR